MTECRFEEDVLAAVAAGTWDAAPDDLKTHVGTCRTCGDLALVSSLLRQDHAAAVAHADVPSSGQVWWRAQVRARAEAARAAARPLFIAQAVAAAALVGALTAVVTWLWPTGAWRYVSSPGEVGLVAGVSIGVWLVLAPVALYLVFARESSD
jgi:hypothetical protein